MLGGAFAGNKCDRAEDREVTTAEARAFMQQHASTIQGFVRDLCAPLSHNHG